MEKQEQEFDLEALAKTEEGKFILPLKTPIVIGKGSEQEKTITELHLIEPRAKHIRRMPSNPTMNDILNICGTLCCLATHEMDELTLSDTTKVAEFFGAFS